MLQVFQVVQSSVIVVSVTCVKSALVKTLTRRGVLRSRKISTFSPLATGERMKLFMAAHKLLMFVLHDVSAQAFNDEERALHAALKPLVGNEDGHFVAAVTSLVQSLLEGRTDCPISGVFGAGKTLSAAAMIARLLVMDPPSRS